MFYSIAFLFTIFFMASALIRMPLEKRDDHEFVSNIVARAARGFKYNIVNNIYELI